MSAAPRTLAMFPGQGSQYVGMGRDLLSDFPGSRLVFEEVEDATKLSIRKLCFEGPEDQLKLTEFTQPCLLAASVALWSTLVDECGFGPDYFAGHSLGEYSALVAAGKLTLAKAASLVHQRGRAMQAAVPPGVGAMAAILQVPESNLKELCAEVVSSFATGTTEHNVLEIVNYNAPTQLVVAGHRGPVEQLVEKVSSFRGKGVILPVSAPFHSSLMVPARKVMEDLLQKTVFAQTPTLVITNTTATPTKDYHGGILAAQIHSPVLWYQSLQWAVDQGHCEAFVEVGPGKVLGGLAKRLVSKDSRIFQADNTLDFVKSWQK